MDRGSFYQKDFPLKGKRFELDIFYEAIMHTCMYVHNDWRCERKMKQIPPQISGETSLLYLSEDAAALLLLLPWDQALRRDKMTRSLEHIHFHFFKGERVCSKSCSVLSSSIIRVEERVRSWLYARRYFGRTFSQPPTNFEHLFLFLSFRWKGDSHPSCSPLLPHRRLIPWRLAPPLPAWTSPWTAGPRPSPSIRKP